MSDAGGPAPEVRAQIYLGGKSDKTEPIHASGKGYRDFQAAFTTRFVVGGKSDHS
jgi:hypothetical protein